jgi:hypothetical protein
MKLKLSLVIAVLAVALSAVVAVAAPTATAKSGGSATGTWSGTATDGITTVAGTFTVNRFTVVNGVLNAVGTYTYTAVNGHSVSAPTGTFTAPVTSINDTSLASGASPTAAAAAAGSCQILDLVLGPLDLDLLGLQVHLDTVHLNITAQQGPGNLLGNLLCAVAGLLDNTGTGGLSGILQSIANLLNQIIAQL